jgi:hypothetical protein
MQKDIFGRSVWRRWKGIKIEVESRREAALLGDGLGNLVQSAQAGSSLGQRCPATIQSAQINIHATEKETERFFRFVLRMRTEWYEMRP